MRTCPICLRETAAEPCECGYAFDTGDRGVALDRARRVHRIASRQIKQGVALLLAIPLMMAVAVFVPQLGVVAAVAGIIEMLGGTASLARGLSHRRAARERIERATRAELPVARVVPPE